MVPVSRPWLPGLCTVVSLAQRWGRIEHGARAWAPGWGGYLCRAGTWRSGSWLRGCTGSCAPVGHGNRTVRREVGASHWLGSGFRGQARVGESGAGAASAAGRGMLHSHGAGRLRGLRSRVHGWEQVVNTPFCKKQAHAQSPVG